MKIISAGQVRVKTQSTRPEHSPSYPLPDGRAGAKNPRECDERQNEPGGGDSGPGQWTGECGAPGGDPGSGRASGCGLPFGGGSLPVGRVRADGARPDVELSRPRSQPGAQGCRDR